MQSTGSWCSRRCPPAWATTPSSACSTRWTPAKDVDGFHPVNVGRLVQKRQTLVACTPLGCATLLDREGIPLKGRHAVVIGRSDIVGKPMALLLLHRDATVTICHSRTVDLPAVCRTADVLVAAIGRPGFVTADFIKPGATVIDVGINRLTEAAEVARFFAEGSRKRQQFEAKGSLLIGDVHPEVERVAGAITPVPGGVGPVDDCHGPRQHGDGRGASGRARPLMVRVALTGGIATGKSYVAQRFRQAGVPVVDADLLAGRWWNRAPPGCARLSTASALTSSTGPAP